MGWSTKIGRAADRRCCARSAGERLFFCICLVAVALCGDRLFADEASDLYRVAVGFYNREEWKPAADNFQRFLKNHGQHSKAENAKFYYGLTLVKLDQFQSARETLRGFVKDYPKNRDRQLAGYWIGHCSYFLDQFADAEKELTEFIAASPDDPLREWALPYLADAELRLHKAESAAQHFRQALDAFPQGEMIDDSRFGLGRALEQMKNGTEAEKIYRELAANRNGLRAADAQLALGDLHFDAGDFTAAVADFETFEKDFPASPRLARAQFNLGSALYKLQEFRKAATAFEKASKSEKYVVESMLWLGLSLKAIPELEQARSIFQTTYEKHRSDPQAEKLLYQWANCEDRRGPRDRARSLYVELANRWPNGALADEALYAATVAAVDLGQAVEAEKLIARFAKDYSGSKLRLREDIQKGRMQMIRSPRDYAGAVQTFQSVLADSEKENTKQQARYYLGYALQHQGEHAAVLEATAPLAAQLEADNSQTDYAGVYVVRAESQRALAQKAAVAAKAGEPVPPDVGKYTAAAVASIRQYFSMAPQGALAPQALAVAAMSEGLAGHKEKAIEYMDVLRKNHSNSAELDRACVELGSIAFSREDFALAEQFYDEAVNRPNSDRHAEALADLGWSLYRQRKFAEAAAAFARVVQEHPSDKLVPEAALQRGISLMDAGQTDEALAAFREAFQRPGDSKEIFRAGLQAARLLARARRTKEADAAFDAAKKRFPKAADGDRLLNEWAAMHYEADNAQRGDEISRRLISEYPNSTLVASAKYNLAESDLIAGRVEPARNQFLVLASAEVVVDANSTPTAEQKRALEQSRNVQERALFQLIQIELGSNNWPEVRRYCDQFLQRFPESERRAEIDLAWSEGAFHQGEFDAAKGRLQHLKELKNNASNKQAPWFARVWVLLAEIDWRLKDYDGVAKTVAEYREWDPQSPLIYQADEVLGRSFKSKGKFPEAREVFQRVLKDPKAEATETAAKCQFLLADTYLLERDYVTAYENFLRVEILYKYPELQAAALYQAGVCQEELENWKKAARQYQDMVQKYPNSEHIPKARERLEYVRKRITSG